MKQILALLLAIGFGATVNLHAADPKPGKAKKIQPTEQQKEQRKTRKEILDKYDTNKDGKLDKSERSKISAEDKEKLAKLVGERRKKAGATADAPSAAPEKN